MEDIKINLQEVTGGGMGWIALTVDKESWRKIVNAVMNLRVP
jgi:hypothetical protein